MIQNILNGPEPIGNRLQHLPLIQLREEGDQMVMAGAKF